MVWIRRGGKGNKQLRGGRKKKVIKIKNKFEPWKFFVNLNILTTLSLTMCYNDVGFKRK